MGFLTGPAMLAKGGHDFNPLWLLGGLGGAAMGGAFDGHGGGHSPSMPGPLGDVSSPMNPIQVGAPSPISSQPGVKKPPVMASLGGALQTLGQGFGGGQGGQMPQLPEMPQQQGMDPFAMLRQFGIDPMANHLGRLGGY